MGTGRGGGVLPIVGCTVRLRPKGVTVLFILYKMVVNFEPADEILRCAQSNISYQAELLYAAILFIEQMGAAFDAMNEMIQMFK